MSQPQLIREMDDTIVRQLRNGMTRKSRIYGEQFKVLYFCGRELIAAKNIEPDGRQYLWRYNFHGLVATYNSGPDPVKREKARARHARELSVAIPG